MSKNKKRKKKLPKRRNAHALDALLRNAGYMKDRRRKRMGKKSWKKEIEQELPNKEN